MKYLCLIYEDESLYERMTRAQQDELIGEYFAFQESIRRSGHYQGGQALQPTHTATTVRVRSGKISTTDGPFIETKEQLGGFFLVEARDMDDAVEVASRIPGARYGGVEVRPIMEFGQP